MSDKELIKQEIERRIENLKFSIENNAFTKELKLDLEGNITTLNSLLQFINSIPEEPASEDLEEEIKSWIPAHIEGGDEYMRKVAIEWSEIVARHFAEWGRNHFEDKSEMVCEETTIVNDWQYGKDPDHAIIPAIHQRIEGFNVGDKVKIIIVKEEQQ